MWIICRVFFNPSLSRSSHFFTKVSQPTTRLLELFWAAKKDKVVPTKIKNIKKKHGKPHFADAIINSEIVGRRGRKRKKTAKALEAEESQIVWE